EAGCAVCGQLEPLKDLKLLSESMCSLDAITNVSGVTRKERHYFSDAIEDIPGPVLADNCKHICKSCEDALLKNDKPKKSLANHLWIGPIPDVLKDLLYAEKMLIAQIRHNKCVTRVDSGRMKMTANTVMFSTPIIKIY
ncbi:hypothetical protein FPV67DRAFT_1384521, partial [Lyophyllum atratum]